MPELPPPLPPSSASFCSRCGQPRSAHAPWCPYNEFVEPTASDEEKQERRTIAVNLFYELVTALPSLEATIGSSELILRAPKNEIMEASFGASVGPRIGRMTFRLRGGEMEITRVDSDVPSIKGIGTALVARLLVEHPEIERIRAFFIDDNAAVYRQTIEEGKSHLDALASTPLAKICAKFGFTSIIPLNERRDPLLRNQIPFLVERPREEK